MVLTKEEWEEWKQHPVTIYFFKALKNQREIFKEYFINGVYEEVDRGKVEGKARLIADLIEMQYEDVQEKISEKP